MLLWISWYYLPTIWNSLFYSRSLQTSTRCSHICILNWEKLSPQPTSKNHVCCWQTNDFFSNCLLFRKFESNRTKHLKTYFCFHTIKICRIQQFMKTKATLTIHSINQKFSKKSSLLYYLYKIFGRKLIHFLSKQHNFHYMSRFDKK